MLERSDAAPAGPVVAAAGAIAVALAVWGVAVFAGLRAHAEEPELRVR